MAARDDIPVELRCANSWCINAKATAKQHFCADCHAKQSKTTATTKAVVNSPATEPVWVAKSRKVEEPAADEQKTKNGQAWAKHKGGTKDRFVPDLDAREEKRGRGKAKKVYAAIETETAGNDTPSPETVALMAGWMRIDKGLQADAHDSSMRMQNPEWQILPGDNLIEE